MEDAKHQEGIRVARLMAEFYLANVRPRQNAQSLKTTGYPLGLQIPETKQDGPHGSSAILHNGEPIGCGSRGLDVSVSGPLPELPLQGVPPANGASTSSGPADK